MDKMNLYSIKHENIKNVFKAIINHGDKMSRAEIADKTDLSIMTVGKIVEALINCEIINQYKEVKDSAGRKAGLVKLNVNRMSVILDLTTYDFAITVVDFSMNPYDKIVYPYDAEFSYLENLCIFLKNVKIYFDKKFGTETSYYGMGVILPGYYNSENDSVVYDRIPELEHIKIKSTIKDITGYTPVHIDSDIDAVTRSIVDNECYKSFEYVENIIIYMGICKSNILKSAIIFDGKVIHGVTNQAGNIGDIYVDNDIKLKTIIEKSNKFDDCINEFCHILYNVINFINPNILLIECDSIKLCTELDNKIRNCLTHKYKLRCDMLPEIVIANDDIKHSHRGLAIKLRDIWFESKM